MPSLLELLDGHIFSGITGNVTYDLLKSAWSRVTRRSWETLYLDSFHTAVIDARPHLVAYAQADGEITVNQDELVRALHSDLQIGPKLARLSALSDEEFIAALADAMVERSVLVIGGHALSREGYTQITRNLVRSATRHFHLSIFADEEVFRQALLTETQHNTDLVEELLRSLRAYSRGVVEQLEQISTDVVEIKQQMPTLAQVNEVLHAVQAIPALVRTELASDAQVRHQLATEREQRWNDRFERLRRAVDDGYSAAVRDDVMSLINEIQQQIAIGEVISPALKGNIFRLGAIAFLPSRPGGDIARARTYLRMARSDSRGEASVKCEIIAAVLLDVTQGIGPALELLADLEGDEPLRIRFSLALQHDDLDTCAQMIAEGRIDLDHATTNPLWARPIMFYYAAIGQRERLLAYADMLIAAGQTGDHLEAAALALTRAAFETFGRFCRDHQVLPEFHYALDLEELIDAELRERAIRYFERAAEAFLQHQCNTDAVRALASAIRLLMDMPESAWRNRLLDRLRELTPTHPLLVAGAVDVDGAGGIGSLEHLERAFADHDADVLLLLHRARQVACGTVGAQQVVDLLIRHEGRFHSSPLTKLQFEIRVWELLQVASADVETEAWLTRISSPPPYEHMRPLCHVAFYRLRNSDTARHWLEQARSVAPNQPEVLFATSTVFAQLGEYTTALEAAEHLFRLLRTSQTAQLRLGLLRSAGRFQELLELLEQTADLMLPEGERRAYQASAMVALGQPQRALVDLEWLVAQGQANINGMLSLAQIYLRLHRHADAVSILHRCIDRHADDPDSRLLLSNVLLTQGQHDESYRVAVQARDHFPDNATVALHLVQMAFSSGHEHAPEIQAALQSLTPGGALADAALVQVADIETARAMMLESMQAAQEADRLYSQIQIPLLLRCYMLQTPLSWYHALVRDRRAIQFVTPRSSLDSPAWWENSRLTAIVIDYSALLGLWALFGDTLLTFLRTSIARIYLPSSLLDILAWEQNNLAGQGQRALEQTRVQVQTTLRQRLARLRLHPLPTTGAIEPIGIAAALSVDLQHIYLTAYAPPDHPLDIPSLDLPALADTLLHAGDLAPHAARSLRNHTPVVMLHAAPALPRGAAIVTNTLTLIAIQQAGALETLLSYCGSLHLLERDWDELCNQVNGAVRRERALRDLDQLQALIALAISDQFFHPEALPLDQRLFQVSAEDEDSEHTVLQHLAITYTDDLLGLAHRHQAPLWTDDRWTALVALPKHMVIDRVGTDTMLDWMYHHGVLDEQQVYGAHTNLVSWGYQGQAINVGYVRWLVRQGMQAQARLLSDTTARYRSSLLGLWAVAKPQSTYGHQSHLVYLRAFAETILGCFGDNASVEVTAAIIQGLDVSRDWPDLVGNEPVHLCDVILRLVALLLYPDDLSATIAVGQLDRFSAWLDSVLQQAQFASVAIDEAWRLIVENVLQLYDTFADDHRGTVGDDLLLKFCLIIMPERALDRVLASRLRVHISAYVGDMLRSEIIWTIKQLDGATIHLAYPQYQWERDYARVVDQAILQTGATPVVAGVITLRPLRDQASLWLRFSLFPTARPNLLTESVGARHDRVMELFSRFADPRRAQRQAVWQIGRQQLAALGLSTRSWEQLRPQLLSNSARVWRAAAHTATRALFCQWPFVRAMLNEAMALGLPALFDVLMRLNADDVRSWLGLDAQFDAATQRHWAERTAANVTLGDDPAVAAARLVDYVARYGYSLFPDALIIRARVVELIVGMPDVQQRAALLQLLLEQARSSVSEALKANSVLIALACRAQTDWVPGDGSDLNSELVNLVVEVTEPYKPNNLQMVQGRLVGQLTSYFYQAWCSKSRASATELAYLAHMAASWIGETLNSRLPHKAVKQVHDALMQDTIRTDFRPVRQPHSLFRPGWASLVNYGAALLLGAPPVLKNALASLFASAPARSALVRCGAQHQTLQAMLNVAAIRPSWLDEPRVGDIPAAVADLLAYVDEATLSTWPEGELYALVVCGTPEAGSMLLMNAIERLPEQADDAEVLKTIGMVMLGIDEPGGEGEVLAQHLLAIAQLTRIQRCGICYNTLIWHLTAVLADTAGYQDTLIAAIHSALRIIPADAEIAKAVVSIVTGMLAHRVSVQQMIDELRDWLMYLGTNEEIPLSAVRAALVILLHWWPELLPSSRSILRESLDALANVPRFPPLWELVRLRERDRALDIWTKRDSF